MEPIQTVPFYDRTYVRSSPARRWKPLRGLLPCLLVSTSLWGQEVDVHSASFLRLWQERTPGLDRQQHFQAIQFLGVDAHGLHSDHVSLHLFGWGRGDLGKASRREGTSGGDLSHAYLRYRAPKGQAELVAGRFTVAQAGGFEWVDGVSGRADLKGGFTVSAFAGRPVWFRHPEDAHRVDYEYQRDFIFGARVARRLGGHGEVGASFLQDGTKPAHELNLPSAHDFTRRHVGLDLRLLTASGLDFTGRTVWDTARHPAPMSGMTEPKKLAEQDYSLKARLGSHVKLQGEFTERNFRAYYAGTTLPSLFRPDERGTFKAHGAKLGWDPTPSLQLGMDYRHTRRDEYGAADRMGIEARWRPTESGLVTGVSIHKVQADDLLRPGVAVAAFGLSHAAFRAWVMAERAPWYASLDGIYHRFEDSAHPALNRQSFEYEVVGSLGRQLTEAFRLSADVSLGSNPSYRHETRGLLRIEYRFGMKAGKANGEGK